MTPTASPSSAIAGPPVMAGAAPAMEMSLTEFMVMAEVWMQLNTSLDSLLLSALEGIERDFRQDGFEVDSSAAKAFLRGASAVGRRMGFRVQHPLFGWCEVQVRLTVTWPAGAALTMLAFAEGKPVRPRSLTAGNLLVQRQWGRTDAAWETLSAASAREAFEQWMSSWSGEEVGAAIAHEVKAFREQLEQELAP